MRPRVPFRFFSTTQRHLADGPLVTFPKPTSRPVRSSHLPHGYTYYKSHNDVPTLPPPATARVYESELEPPHIPRCSVFHYLFPPTKKGKQPKYYLVPDPKTVAFIDGLTGRTLFRSDLPIQATWTRSGLRKLGVGKGDVACIFGENSLEWVSACYGAQAAALVVSPSNYA